MVGFNERVTERYENWLLSPPGCYCNLRERKLMIEMICPSGDERVLDLECRTGALLFDLGRQGCTVTGHSVSDQMLDRARRKLGGRASFHRGDWHDLPFSDNEFDIVLCMIVLEFCKSPHKVIAEAARVCCGTIAVGFYNAWSFGGGRRRLKDMFGPEISAMARLYSIWDMRNIVRSSLPGAPLRWASLGMLNWQEHKTMVSGDEKITARRNPFGIFSAMVFPATVSMITIQEPLRERLGLGVPTGGKVAGAARETER